MIRVCTRVQYSSIPGFSNVRAYVCICVNHQSSRRSSEAKVTAAAGILPLAVVVIMSTAYGGGGGGGFGGFPYRSAHQQGTDGRGSGGGRQRRRPRNKKRKTPPSLLCAADIVIPAPQRVRLIGRGGSVIKELRDSTGATIFVPKQDDTTARRRTPDKRPVRVKAENVASLLHACWKIVSLGLNTHETACCKVRIPSNGPNLCGKVERKARFFYANNGGMAVYCVESFLDSEEVDIVVDNVKFANASNNAQHETVFLEEQEQHPSTLIFAYGQAPDALVRALEDATSSLWKKECLSDIEPIQHKLPFGALTVGTYNVLHPVYAKKYKEYAGLSKMEHASNWTSFRAPTISRILLECNLDLYLLQEVDMQDLLTIPELTNQYHVIVYSHPLREAGDAVAILAAKHRFVVQRQEMVPFQSKENPNRYYMCAATAVIKDKVTNLSYLVASTHFYKKKSHQPDTTLMDYLQSHSNECNAVIWGGDCNDEYKNKRSSISDEYSYVAEGQNTRGAKHIDWIFYSGNCFEGWRSEATEAFVDATMKILEPTGYPPSDHFGEAITLSPASSMEKLA